MLESVKICRKNTAGVLLNKVESNEGGVKA